MINNKNYIYKQMSNTYNTYDFNPDTPFIPQKCCDINIDIDDLKDDIIEAIDNSNDNLTHKLYHTNKHIDCASDNIIREVHKANCMCKIATKEDIKNAIDNINSHTDSKFNEIDFISQFENLNNQIKNLKDGE